jgi:hypothetical protein
MATTTVCLYFGEDEEPHYIFEMDIIPRAGETFTFESHKGLRYGTVKRVDWEVNFRNAAKFVGVGLFVEENE